MAVVLVSPGRRMHSHSRQVIYNVARLSCVAGQTLGACLCLAGSLHIFSMWLGEGGCPVAINTVPTATSMATATIVGTLRRGSPLAECNRKVEPGRRSGCIPPTVDVAFAAPQ